MFKKTKLNNGLRIVTAPMKGTKTVTVLVVAGTGSKYENKKNNGISHFLEHLVFKGTKKRPDTKAIAQDLEKVGGEFNAFTSKEITGFYAKVASEHLDVALDVISDIYLNAKLPAREIEREKGVIIEEINMYEDTPMALSPMLFEKLLYGDTPAGWSTLGTKENIREMERREIIEYFNKHYLSENTVVGVTGDLNKKIEAKIKNYFKKIRTGNSPDKEKVVEGQAKPEILVSNKKSDQTHLCLGVRTFDIFDKRKYALGLLATILGGNMSSRLFLALRERRGLAYYLKTGAEGYSDSGYLMTQCGVPNDKVNEAIKIILSEYRKIARQKIGQVELKRVKDYIKGKLLLNLESSDEVASFLLEQEVSLGKILKPEEYFKKLSKVTASELQAIAKEIFVNNRLNLALIGPCKERKEFEKVIKF